MVAQCASSRSQSGNATLTAEHRRLREAAEGTRKWRRWGPYLSERQWGTVREDYSASGDAWSFVPHDQARSRAYRWGEDGLAGLSDAKQRLCLALALWNGRDPFLKERMFGVPGGGGGGNHGEDVKECYYYLDATPTHSYLKYLYKYPQAEFPYRRLIEENPSWKKDSLEVELVDTGVFDHTVAMDSLIHYRAPDAICVLSALAARTRASILFTFAPRTPALAAMHAAGKLFPRADRAPAIEPVAPRKLHALCAREPGLDLWQSGRTQRIASGFYTSQAFELRRKAEPDVGGRR